MSDLPENWVEKVEKSSKRTFYYNKITKQSQWKKPVIESNENTLQPLLTSSLISPKSFLSYPWTRRYDRTSGRYFYYNQETKITQWKSPVEEENILSNSSSKSTSFSFSEISLPPNWVRKFDAKTQREFYYNRETKITQWSRPKSEIKENENANVSYKKEEKIEEKKEEIEEYSSEVSEEKKKKPKKKKKSEYEEINEKEEGEKDIIEKKEKSEKKKKEDEKENKTLKNKEKEEDKKKNESDSKKKNNKMENDEKENEVDEKKGELKDEQKKVDEKKNELKDEQKKVDEKKKLHEDGVFSNNYFYMYYFYFYFRCCNYSF
jgi:hypothetical protein